MSCLMSRWFYLYLVSNESILVKDLEKKNCSVTLWTYNISYIIIHFSRPTKALWISTMYSLWRFVRFLDILKTSHYATISYRQLFSTVLLSSAILVAIAAIVAIARIASQEQSWIASIVLLATITQV